MNTDNGGLTIEEVRAAYAAGESPRALIGGLLEAARAGDPAVWIHLLDAAEMAAHLDRLDRQPRDLPLWGVPFAIKDNIDLAGVPTTAACPAYSYTPGRSAHVVQRLIDAGAVPLGKTNLDQFATGLVGVRSPYGVPGNPRAPGIIPGGSSSGSAVAVAAGLASFALGTDTAGSGRVPAALNGIVGLKPTRGLLSCAGVVPACRTLDCVSIFANTVADAAAVLAIAEGFDPEDPYSREAPASPVPVAFEVQRSPSAFTFGVPALDALDLHAPLRPLFEAAIARLEALGGQRIEIDYAPFAETARLLYEGPWVAERYLAAGPLIERNPEALHPVTRQIIAGGAAPRATDAFAAQYRLAALRRRVEPIWRSIDMLLLPTMPCTPTLAEVEADPIGVNSRLGKYTNFVNLLDLCGLAIPAGATAAGVPWGVTLLAPAFHDSAVAALATRMLGEAGTLVNPRPADTLPLAVCGAHMRGLPLNSQLTALGGRFVREAHTAPCYRMLALPPVEGLPARPGLVRAADGASLPVEVWALPAAAIGHLLRQIAPPLGLGTTLLDDGTRVTGFICEGGTTAPDITAHGGWRNWLTGRQGVH